MGHDLLKDVGITIILPAFNRWVIIHLNNVRIPVIIFYVNPIEPVSDCICCINTETDNVGGTLSGVTLSTPQ